MSFLRKASTGVLRNFRPRAAQSEGKFFGEGARTDKNGLLFGETPTPPGQKRQWEDWEAPWYAAMTAAALMLGFGLSSRPETSMMVWAKRQAKKELDAEAA